MATRGPSSLRFKGPALVRAPRGQGEPVLLLPGFKAPESSMYPLRRLLRLKGYDAHTWGLGVNQGDVQHYVDALKPRVKDLTQSTGTAVALIGWSLGGVVSREIARESPANVSTIVSWPACIDRFSRNATHYEVDATHFSMGIDPTVWGIVLKRLRQAR